MNWLFVQLIGVNKRNADIESDDFLWAGNSYLISD